MPVQQSFDLRTWGGRRRGAGRPSTRDRDALPHVARDAFTRPMPVHVTLRFAEHVWNLRSERSYAVIHRALEAARRRTDARVVHFTILGNHLHLICDADSSDALSNAVRALSTRLTRGLNRMMPDRIRLRGPVRRARPAHAGRGAERGAVRRRELREPRVALRRAGARGVGGSVLVGGGEGAAAGARGPHRAVGDEGGGELASAERTGSSQARGSHRVGRGLV